MNIVEITKEINQEVKESREYHAIGKAVKEWVREQSLTCYAIHEIKLEVAKRVQ